MSAWIEHLPGPCPVAKGTRIEIRWYTGLEVVTRALLDSGETFIGPSGDICIVSCKAGGAWLVGNIIAYRLSGTPDKARTTRTAMFKNLLDTRHSIPADAPEVVTPAPSRKPVRAG